MAMGASTCRPVREPGLQPDSGAAGLARGRNSDRGRIRHAQSRTERDPRQHAAFRAALWRRATNHYRSGVTVRVPSLPEIVTYGKDEAEALAMAEDAIRLVLEDSMPRGEPLPNDEPARIREVTVTLAA